MLKHSDRSCTRRRLLDGFQQRAWSTSQRPAAAPSVMSATNYSASRSAWSPPQRLQENEKRLGETPRGRSISKEIDSPRKDGSEFPVETPRRYVQFEGKEYNCGSRTTSASASARKKSTRCWTQRTAAGAEMEAIGRLADGGPAHNFNNILTALWRILRAPCWRSFRRDSSMPARARQIKRAADHAAALHRAFWSSAGARRTAGKARPECRCGADKLLLRDLIRSDIKIVTALAPVGALYWRIAARSSRVLANLVVNMPPDADGERRRDWDRDRDLEIDTPLPTTGGAPARARRVFELLGAVNR